MYSNKMSFKKQESTYSRNCETFTQSPGTSHLTDNFTRISKVTEDHNTFCGERSFQNLSIGSQDHSIPAAATLLQPSAISFPPLEDNLALDNFLISLDFRELPLPQALSVIDWILQNGKVTPKISQKIHEYLFENQGAFEKFLRLNGSRPDEQNRLFESFLKILDEDLLNANKSTWLPQVLNFAFSNLRFDWIQIKNEDVPPDFHQKLMNFEVQVKSDQIEKKIFDFETENPGKYQSWIKLRMEGSTTISIPSNDQKPAISNWHAANSKMMAKAISPSKRFGFSTMQIIHKQLTKGEVNNPGEIRSHPARSTSARLLYPISQRDLYQKNEDFESWLNNQIELLRKRGKKCNHHRSPSIPTTAFHPSF